MRKLVVYNLERVKGIEPSSSAWKAEVLPLNYTRRCGTGGRDRTGTPEEHDFESCASANSATPALHLEAATGFEPVIRVLQTHALPLGYAALILERKTGFEPATPTLARWCSTTELLPHYWASWIRTNACRSQSAMPYRLAIAH